MQHSALKLKNLCKSAEKIDKRNGLDLLSISGIASVVTCVNDRIFYFGGSPDLEP